MSTGNNDFDMVTFQPFGEETLMEEEEMQMRPSPQEVERQKEIEKNRKKSQQFNARLAQQNKSKIHRKKTNSSNSFAKVKAILFGIFLAIIFIGYDVYKTIGG